MPDTIARRLISEGSRRRADYSISVDPYHAARASPRAIRSPGMNLQAEVRRLPSTTRDWRGASRIHLPQCQWFTGLTNLALFIDRELHAHAMLDGEVACFDSQGRPLILELMFRRGAKADKHLS